MQIEAWRAAGTLSEVHVAFSREQKEKVYVQHLLWNNRESTWKLMQDDGAHIYICGFVCSVMVLS